jgi:RND superfamily putative drug exporter
MFQVLGKFVSRFWPILLIAWIGLLVGTKRAAPPWDEVAQDKEFGFLPPDAPSRRSEKRFEEAFPDERAGSNIVLVLHRESPGPTNLDSDKKFIEDVLEPALRQIAQEDGGFASELAPQEEPSSAGTEQRRPRSIIERVRTPNAPGTGALLTSADSRALLVVVDLTTEFLSKRNWPIIDKIAGLISDLQRQGKVPVGLDISMAGSAVVGRDHTRAELQSARDTELLTVILVVALLILIYRAPLLALIPLVTVYLGVQLSINVLALLSKAGYVSLFQGIQIYITILGYGAGVDYCLFLTARYKEELDRGAGWADAVTRAIGSVGSALVASAGTVMCGIGMMVFAKFGKFHEAGIAIPLCLFLVLCATLTFSSALLRLAGRWAFWPLRIQSDQERHAAPPRGEFWSRLARTDGFHRMWEKTARVLLRRPGRIWLGSVVPMLPFAVVAAVLYNYVSYDFIGNLPAKATSVVGTRALEEHFPAGLMGPTTVLLVDPKADFRSDKGRALVEQLTTRLGERTEELGLADLRSLTAPLGITEAARRAFLGTDMPQEAIQHAVRQEALDRYVTDFGERAKIGTRLELIFKRDPFSRRSVDDLERVEQIVQSSLPPDLQQESQLYFLGPAASIRDLNTVIEGDRLRIELLVLASVFVVLILLLRKLTISLYLILSVLLSYYATLGLAFAVFWLINPHGFSGIDWKVAIFLFTILIAVGEDYNIFLMTRIREEQERYGPVRGITVALTRTGPIISSCGLIMAGTFASLLAGTLSEMKQLGFALAFGVLLDTFVVRPILVPAFLIMLHTGKFRLPKWTRGEPEPQVRVERVSVPPFPSEGPVNRAEGGIKDEVERLARKNR